MIAASDWKNVLALATLLAACGGVEADGAGEGTGGTGVDVRPQECEPYSPVECPDPSPTYADVEPIFRAVCVSCHSGAPGAEWPLTTHGHIADWQGEVRGFLSDCTMPPPESGIVLPANERKLILDWLRCGLPQ